MSAGGSAVGIYAHRNGVHLYFKHTVDSPNKKPPGTGLELFCAGNQYVLMPPSAYLDTDVIPHQTGFYTCNDSNLDGLKPVPQDLVNFLMEKGLNSPDQREWVPSKWRIGYLTNDLSTVHCRVAECAQENFG